MPVYYAGFRVVIWGRFWFRNRFQSRLLDGRPCKRRLGRVSKCDKKWHTERTDEWGIWNSFWVFFCCCFSCWSRADRRRRIQKRRGGPSLRNGLVAPRRPWPGRHISVRRMSWKYSKPRELEGRNGGLIKTSDAFHCRHTAALSLTTSLIKKQH
jgi:hypothetical protein